MSEQTVTIQDLTNIDLFEPQAGMVLLRQWTENEVTKGGIIIPNADKNTLLVGTVLRVGIEDTSLGDCLTLEEGDVVIFGDHLPRPLPILGENIIIVVIRDVFGRITPPEQENFPECEEHSDGNTTKTEN